MDCGDLHRVDYGAFSSSLHGKIWAGSSTPLPINGTIEVTQRCNLRCTHCYVPEADRLPNNVRSRECRREPLAFDEIRRIVDEFSDAGCLWLLVTGGEPLLRRDFLDLYLHAKRRGLLLTIFTNATLMTARIADALAEYRPFKVEVTLYGATAPTYEATTGIPGSFERCVRGIDLMVERGVPIVVKSIVLRANAHEFDLMREFAEQRGVHFRWDSQVHPRLDGDLGPTQARLTPEEMVELELTDPQRVLSWRELLEQTRHIRLDSRVFNCRAGLGSFHVDAYGILRPCGFVGRYGYDLRAGSFSDGYTQYFPYVRGLRHEGMSACNNCELTSLCSVCPAWQDLESNGRNGPVGHVCRFANLLAKALEPLDNANRVAPMLSDSQSNNKRR